VDLTCGEANTIKIEFAEDFDPEETGARILEWAF
jgi:hypothetical protein